MSESRFDLAITSYYSDLPIDKLVQALMKIMGCENDPHLEFKLSDALLSNGSKSVVMENLTEAEGKVYQAHFGKLNVATELQAALALVAKETESSNDAVEQHTCPACQHVQPKAKKNEPNVCQNCGVVAEKFEKYQEKVKILEQERQKLEQTQTKALRDALDRARYAEQEKLRQEARQQLGIEEKKTSPVVLLGAIAVVLALGGGTFFGMKHLGLMSSEAESSATDALAAPEEIPQEKKGINISIQPPSGGITVSGISNPADRPVVAAPDLENYGAQQQLPVGATDLTQFGENFTGDIASTAGLDASDQASRGAQGRASTAFAAPQRLLPSELELLKLSLQTPVAAQKFEQIDLAGYQEKQARLERLLGLGMPELSLVFADECQDVYAGSLLMLRVAQVNHREAGGAAKKEILRALDALTEKAPTGSHSILVLNSLAIAQGLFDETEKSQETLQRAAKKLTETQVDSIPVFDISQQYDLLLQMMQDHKQYGYSKGAKLLQSEAEAILAKVAAEGDLLLRSQAYTSLASGALILGEDKKAHEWVQKVEDPSARTQLSKYLPVAAITN
ncbi:MAG: hypothetical protein CR991_07425 [Proteobacteria bacterium]|nr:MAG: hypothetical protein CR991_07425 [Pseudomonadota bacterium]